MKDSNTQQKASPLRIKFLEEKKNTLDVAKNFLDTNSVAQNVTEEHKQTLRNRVNNAVIGDDLGQAVRDLEELRDAKTGILYHRRKDVLIRDSRLSHDPPIRETEAYEIQYLNAINAGIDIIREQKGKNDLEANLKEKARNFMNRFSKNSGKSQEELSDLLKQEINDLGNFMENKGIKNPFIKLNIAKDFQNFNNDHLNTVTLLSVKDKNQKDCVAIQAEVGFKGVTEKQKLEYDKILNDIEPKPDWYKVMPKWEQNLCKKYASKIIDGEHIIPTQLRQIAAMKNALERTTAVYDSKNKEIIPLYASKHAGTFASFAGQTRLAEFKQQSIKAQKKFEKELVELKQKLMETQNQSRKEQIKQQIEYTKKQKLQEEEKVKKQIEDFKKELEPIRDRVTEENIKQASEFSGKPVHINSLNAGPKLGTAQDKEIVKRMTRAIRKLGGKVTNTAFNLFRLSRLANDFTGAKVGLTELAECFPEGKEFNQIRSYLQYKRFRPQMISAKVAQNKAKLLFNNGLIDKKTYRILDYAINLKSSIKKADVIFFRGRDSENASLNVSRDLNRLVSTISNLDPDTPPKGMTKVPSQEEIWRMCASGLDRTNLAEHDQAAQALADHLKVDIKYVDKQLINSGHVAHQTGGISSGGGSLGCYGTKKENIMGMPEERQESLARIVEESASNNKIKKRKKLRKKLGKLKRLQNFIFKRVFKKYYSTIPAPVTPSNSKGSNKQIIK